MITPILATNTASAVPGNSKDSSAIGYPSLKPHTRGDVSGSISATNAQLIHSCDFSISIKKNMALRKYIRAIAKWIREGIRKIWYEARND